ncbi:hypothetical protein GUJ93_ZPchr0013g35236 [Zizania palustris]|uniref:Uncharacterized protein n=1 Tax=Zizania palustris TaxID=103762 RepID=A0A8J5X3V5_ZIZPA|nr:hypothetical protein GUJ93_ZPchr0013g35236 [Zizania palustris]
MSVDSLTAPIAPRRLHLGGDPRCLDSVALPSHRLDSDADGRGQIFRVAPDTEGSIVALTAEVVVALTVKGRRRSHCRESLSRRCRKPLPSIGNRPPAPRATPIIYATDAPNQSLPSAFICSVGFFSSFRWKPSRNGFT